MLTMDEAQKTAMRYWQKTTYELQVIFSTKSIEALRNMVGNGIAILADSVYRPWSSEGQCIEMVGLADSIPNLDIGFIWAKNRKKTLQMEAFQKFLRVRQTLRTNKVS